MKKGITLIELVMAVAILAPLLLLAASLDYTALRELPCAAALTQTSLRMQNMLQALRQDVESADSLQLNGQSVELHGKAGLTTYSRNGGNFTRTVQRPPEKADVRTWPLPEADIQWKAWNEKGRNYALEVRTALIVRENGQPRKKLANSQVFHLGADGSLEAVK
jgi:prepilin-type N-terminal cleavage/methylation domain-containing protein